MTRFLLGSFAETLLQHTTLPAVVVSPRHAAPNRFERVLVPEAAMKEPAARLGAPVSVVPRETIATQAAAGSIIAMPAKDVTTREIIRIAKVPVLVS